MKKRVPKQLGALLGVLLHVHASCANMTAIMLHPDWSQGDPGSTCLEGPLVGPEAMVVRRMSNKTNSVGRHSSSSSAMAADAAAAVAAVGEYQCVGGVVGVTHIIHVSIE